jgi:hypothetical protein
VSPRVDPVGFVAMSRIAGRKLVRMRVASDETYYTAAAARRLLDELAIALARVEQSDEDDAYDAGRQGHGCGGCEVCERAGVGA